MTDRRDVLATLAAGVAAIPVAAMGQETLPTAKQTKTKPEVEEQCDCCASEHGGGEVPSSPDYFPNVPVETHTGQRALFYNDLLRGKLVLVNFMSIKNDEHYPVTENLSHVPKLLHRQAPRTDIAHDLEGPARVGERPGTTPLDGHACAFEVALRRSVAHDAPNTGRVV